LKDLITKYITLNGTKVKRKKQLFIFPSATHKNRGAQATTTTTTTTIYYPFYHRRTRRFHNLVESRSKDNQVNQSSVVVVVPSKKNKSAQNPKGIWPGIGWQSRKLAEFVRFPSSIVCSLFFFNHRLARRHHSEAKKAKRKQISSSIVKRKGIKNNALSQ